MTPSRSSKAISAADNPKPVAVDIVAVLAELGARDGLDPVGAVDAQRRRRDDDTADLVVLNPFEHAALVQVAVAHDLVDVAHRR
jgi:hypothetical protein